MEHTISRSPRLDLVVRRSTCLPARRTAPRRHVVPRRSIYRRRRFAAGVAAAFAAITLGLGVQAVVSGPGGGPASAAGAGSLEAGSRTVVASQGESLWDIAALHHGDADFHRYLEELIALNGVTTIEVGQPVWLP